MSNKPRTKKPMNHKRIASSLIKNDFRNTVFLMLPSFDSLMPVHFSCNKRKLLFKPQTLQYYKQVKAHWNTCLFILTRNPVNGVEELEFKDEIYLNGTYLEAAHLALDDLEAWVDKVNPARRVNVGFAITMKEQKITLEDVERWVANDSGFGEASAVITRKDDRIETERQIKLLEAL